MAVSNRPTTLQAIARELGLHVSTVSRVLNGPASDSSRAASQATIQRIRRLAAERDYHPNPHAKSLRTQHSNLIGVLVPRLSDLVLATIYEGIEEAAVDLGLSTFVTNTGDRPENQRARTQIIVDRRVDGLIFGDAHIDGGFLHEVAEQGLRFVLTNRRVPGFPSVTCDDYMGGRLVADHLLELGHERVAVIAGATYASTGVDRTAGFVDRCREVGVEITPERIVHSTFDTAGGRVAAEEILSAQRPPTALFVVNDFTAIGAIGAARDRGLRIGRDLAIVGFNDVPLAAELPVPLTSVRSDMHEMGRRATHMLAQVLAGEEVTSERLVPTLVARESTLGEQRQPGAEFRDGP